jgi:hypothetical protein
MNKPLDRVIFPCYVHFVNTRDEKFDLNSLLLLDEISNNKDLTQRTSHKPGSPTMNSYLKTLISKGYITVSGIEQRYLLSDQAAPKARLISAPQN